MPKKYFVNWKDLKYKFFDTIEKQIKNDTPHNIAVGCALGIVVNFIPTLGVGFVVAFILAVLFKANRASAAATSLVTGPLVPLMYTLNLAIGGLIIAPAKGKESFVELIIYQYSIALRRSNIQDRIFNFLEFFGSTFILGAAINVTVFGFACYLFIISLLNKKAR